VADAPLVSIIIPTYNRAQLLERCLLSVGKQDYKALEVVVVDDVSTDETPAVVERFSDMLCRRGIRVYVVKLPVNSGPAVARNRGVAAARGSHLSFLDSDDLMEPPFVSTIIELLNRYPQCTLGFCEAWRIDASDRKIGRLESGLPDEPGEGVLHTPFDHLARHELFQTSSVLMRREAFEQVGGFDETLRYSEDTDLWWRLAKTSDFTYTVKALMCHRYHPDNVSKNEEALVYSIRVHLRHLPDVRDPVSRSTHLERIQRRQILLQEKLLRDARPADSYGDLLKQAIAVASLRFRVGRLLIRGPNWLGRIYAAGIQALRGTRRILNRTHAHDFSKRS
jgi:teichuronic acid biosynthesis glycosyltransferase TuaG